MRGAFDDRRGLFAHGPKSRLLHMDVWAQNILVDAEGRLTGLIDWDRALWGDPEIEFAVLDYCGISEPEFWDGYGTDGDPRQGDEAAQVRRFIYLLYEMQKYIVIRKGRGSDVSAAMRHRDQCLHLARMLNEM
jgi:fructosamine-3-kinase